MTVDSTAVPDSAGKTAPSRAKIRGVVSIDTERCKGCGYCIEFCPTNVLVMSARFNSKGYHYPEVAAPDKCTGCDLCGIYCPDFAIHGTRLPDPGSLKE